MPLLVAKIRWKCNQCNKTYWIKPGKAKNKKYCSRECHYASMRVENPVRKIQSKKPSYKDKKCIMCDNIFTPHTIIQKYCSRNCALKAVWKRNKDNNTRERPCEMCHKIFRPRPNNAGRFCSRECNFAGQKGSNGPNWKGGKHIDAYGYVNISKPDHPKAFGHGGYVKEHRLVMEQTLGRQLTSKETVHHINGDRSDNRPENLQLRQGKHGAGIKVVCNSCGSGDVTSANI